jgi:hypothetical protein
MGSDDLNAICHRIVPHPVSTPDADRHSCWLIQAIDKLTKGSSQPPILLAQGMMEDIYQCRGEAQNCDGQLAQKSLFGHILSFSGTFLHEMRKLAICNRMK